MNAGSNHTNNNYILADGRWSGMHGIGRFSKEVLARLQHADILTEGPKPLSVQSLFWQYQQLVKQKKKYKIFFTPGFNPVSYSPIPFVLTIHDLIHLFALGKKSFRKKMYYEFLLKPSIMRAYKILTVSDYSKKTILEWANIPAEKVINVGCGISEKISATGSKYNPGYPYLLHIGNANKTHKNIARLLQAFAQAKIDTDFRCIFTGDFSPELNNIVHQYHLENRIVIQKNLSENKLAEYYRGAHAVIFPSLYEGFGLPVLEGMAAGVPVLASNITSIPEVAGDAALLIDPQSIDAITAGIEKIIQDTALRPMLIQRGLERAKLFSWDETAKKIQAVLDFSV